LKIILCIFAALSFVVSAKPAFIKVHQFDIEYEISGKGKHIVLLEGGAGAGLSDWDPVFTRIAEHATVIRYSRVGNGHSTAIKQHFSSRDYADHARELLTRLNIQEPVILLAHSYGGNIARDFAANYQEQVKALLLLDPSSEHDVDIMRAIDLERANKEIAQIKLDDMAKGMSNNYLDFWSKRPLPGFPHIQNIPVTVIASTKKYKAPPNLFFSDKARTMWGQVWQQWAGAFPLGRAVLTEKSGHHVQFDEPDLVLTELLLLLQKLDKQSVNVS